MIIAIMNQKGGVGKTTSAITLGAGLARNELRTLIVDLDPQGHIAQAMGYDKRPGLYNFIVENLPLKKVIIQAQRNLDLLPGDKTTDAVKNYLRTIYFAERTLLDKLAPAPYDIILLDTAPSKDILHVAAHVSADWLLIPTRLDALAIDGVNEVLRSFAETAMQGESRSRGYCVVPTFFDRVTKETLLQLEALIKTFGKNVWPPIPADVKAREAPAYGKTLWDYSPHSPVIRGYPVDGGRAGGYQQVLERMLGVVDGR